MCWKLAEFSDIDTWPDELTDKQKFITIYGEEYFRKAFEDLNKLYIEIYNDGGDICKDKLPEIKCQTLIIHGAEDGAVPYSHADYFKKNIALSELVCYMLIIDN
ncbi:unnamed protein product [Orchesella dallaii]|uniref:Uncharacterized protein n=1 Tax=Orchesella dallaii TaxID=48710 RepID=A0ABP1QL37_9HEXA